ncbi:uncharacterized protein [Onthophagus taurus]|uniref:uncharacterized protein isoform X1 n=1 Tax=Onthophagus taurus TaxID=166361 RepID=UPI000C201F11|nr:uncharacterized protein LOC111415312 isoform X1 [Onthophagus taurus]
MASTDDIKEFAVVEFPEEEINGTMPLAIISNAWLVEENMDMMCWWPSYIKSDSEREKLIVNRTPLDKSKCDKCLVNVIYSSSHYTNALTKLNFLSKRTNVPLI